MKPIDEVGLGVYIGKLPKADELYRLPDVNATLHSHLGNASTDPAALMTIASEKMHNVLSEFNEKHALGIKSTTEDIDKVLYYVGKTMYSLYCLTESVSPEDREKISQSFTNAVLLNRSND